VEEEGRESDENMPSDNALEALYAIVPPTALYTSAQHCENPQSKNLH